MITEKKEGDTYTWGKERISVVKVVDGKKVTEHLLGKPYQMDDHAWRSFGEVLVGILNGASPPAPIDLDEKPAELFIRERRMRFTSLYPTDFHFLLRMCSTDDDNWNDEGLIHCTYKESFQPYDVTLDGWMSIRHNDRCPTSWPEPRVSSPIFNIPDNAEDSWLQEIGMFCYRLEKWDPADVEQWIACQTRLGGMGREYQDSQIQRNIQGFQRMREAVFITYNVPARITTIRKERQDKNRPPRPLQVEEGATVRFKTGSKTAIVEGFIKVPETKDSGILIARLDREINGSVFHLSQNLVPLPPCEHTIGPSDPEDPESSSGVCSKCGKGTGSWYCPSNPPSHVCEYPDDDEYCIHCGNPDERK